MSVATAQIVPHPQRFELYGPIHKALRAFMSDTLVAVGRMDTADDHDLGVTLEQARMLLTVMTIHLEDENRFVHTAMEARRPGSTAHTAHDHVEHECAIGELRTLIDGVASAAAQDRARLALTLYRRLALFVAENLAHMEIEERENMAVLWADYTDEELQAIEASIVASVPPAAMSIAVRWFMAGLNHSERVGWLQGMRHGAPPAVFEGALAIARGNLSARDWSKLAAALALPAALAA